MKKTLQTIHNLTNALALTLLITTFFNTTLTAQSCPGYRTQTQGGWGSAPKGNNPGSYLHKNFAAAFPNGLEVGCNFKLRFTTPQAVTDFLPSGGTASALTQSYTNPGNKYSNVLAGQVTALKLSVYFDLLDPMFGSNIMPLMYLKVADGPFQGMTVDQILNEGENALGGCHTNHSITELNDVISKINESYVDGNVSGSLLECVSQDETNTNAYRENPYLNVQLNVSANSKNVEINWISTTNDKSDYFVVQKMNNNSYFEDIQVVNNVSNTKTQYYVQKDINPTEGVNVYRIKTFLKDGSFAFSSIKSVEFKREEQSRVATFPNPANEVVNIDLSAFNDKDVTVIFYNNFGQVIKTQVFENVSGSIHQVETTDLKIGNYMMVLNSKGARVKSQTIQIAR